MSLANAVLKIAPCCVRRGIAVLFCLTLVGCGGQYRDHGYVPPPEDLEQIVVGIDTRSTVEETLGSASAQSVADESSIYFVRSRVRTFAMLAPEVVEREVVAISFDSGGIVANVEKFGLEKGQVVPLARRVTSSGVSDKSFLRQLLGNIGRFTPGSASIDG
ncbi:outer membrane protein assembly factor BamE [Roseobacter sp.]|uniref:outer membrane protein assembly factor BamE n=1 Tax=Roseobacter sp. TaxID=1907202 RepID=UPI00385F1E91